MAPLEILTGMYLFRSAVRWGVIYYGSGLKCVCYSPMKRARLSALDFLTGPPDPGETFLLGGGL